MGYIINYCLKDRNLKVINLIICYIEGMFYLNYRDILDNLNFWLVEIGKSYFYILYSICFV